MKTIFIFLAGLFSTSSVDHVYLATYKLATDFSKNSHVSKDVVKDLILNDMTYQFVTNPKYCYLKNTSRMEAQGLKVEVSGEENIYIDYTEKTASYKLEGECMKFSEVKFLKTGSNIKINGFTATRYESKDKNLIVYTSKELPWYIQPSLFAIKKFDGAVVKFVNLKAKYGFDLINYSVTKNPEYLKTFDKISHRKCEKVAIELNPFFK